MAPDVACVDCERRRRWKRTYGEPLAVLLVAAALLSVYPHATPCYNFSVLADAFLHGRIWVDWTGPNVDAVLFNGQHWVIEGPVPAFLVMPLVPWLGATSGWAETVASLIMGAVTVCLYWLAFKRLGLSRAPRLWLTAFAFVGTDLWWCSIASSVWFFAVVVSNAAAAGAFCEMLGRRRGWLIGALAVAAVGTRFTMLPVLALYPFLMASGAFNSRFGLRRALVPYAVVVALGAAAWVSYNEIRWGTLGDIGYQLFCAQDGVCKNGLFGLQYLGYELYAFFLRAPDTKITDQIAYWPYLGVSVEGLALTFTSPALIAACWARRSRTTTALWITTLLVAAPSFVYYVNGYLQVGMRHALDFEPFLFILMAIAFRDNWRQWFAALVAFSLVVGVWQVWFWIFWMNK